MRLAVIGTGVIGRLRAQTVHDHPATTLVGVADVNRVSAVETASRYASRAYADYRHLLDELSPDGVMISSPVTLHEEMCRAAFERGCHVLVEKPLSNSVASCRNILRAAQDAGRALAVGFNHRFYPSIKFLRQVVDDSRLGELDHLRVFGGHDGLHNFRAEWMYKGELSGGGAMLDVGIHMTDLARYIVGEITEVYGVASNRVWNVPGSEDNAVAVMRTERGIPVIYQATWDEWRGYNWYLDVYGTRGMVRASYAPMFNLLVTQERPGAPRRAATRRYPEIMVREKLRGWQTTTKLSFDDELREFLRMVGGADDAAIADGWAGVRANEIAAALYRSTAEGRAIALPERDAAAGAPATTSGSSLRA
jgi:predicted dehydrogenase